MGEVYRARDSRLDRTVAIKVLPAHLSDSTEAKQRFEREARAVSALNHPNICTLYDIGRQDGVDYLVMEFLEGQTLAERLMKGPLPPEQVVKYGIEICEGLEKAHRTGVVHRDLKPGNIMLTKTGAKLMDFGLAKAATASATLSSSLGMTVSGPSADQPLTARGMVVGTFQYMSPEQVEGKEADSRSDIFALGAVLYEMASGKRAFTGKTQASIVAAILAAEPQPISTLQPMTPPALDRVVTTCLAKDPDERFQTAHDLKLQLKWIAEGGSKAGIAAPVAARRKIRERIVWALAAAVVASGLTLAARYYAARPVSESPLLVAVIPPAGVFPDTAGRDGPPQISPDGSRIAFVGCKTAAASSSMAGSTLCSIWLRSLHSADAHEVAGTSGGYSPFWSSDASDIGFFADGKLKRVAANGGPVQVICDAEDGRGGSWSSSGTIVFVPTRTSPIFRVPAAGGTPEAITRTALATNVAGFGSHRWPHFLPDGEHFVYVTTPTGSCSDASEMHFGSLDGKQDVPLMRACGSAVFANGHLIYWRDGNLVAQPFDPRRGVLSGIAAALVERAAFDSLFSFGEFSASEDGKLVYVAGEGVIGTQLGWYDRTGKMVGTLGESDQYQDVAISPDGVRVVINAMHMKQSEIRVLDARGTRSRLASGGLNLSPAWSADGRQVYFTSDVNGPRDIFVKAADGSGDKQHVVKFEKDQFGAAFLAASPDGKYLAYVVIGPAGKLDIYTVPLTGDRRPRPFLNSPANESVPTFSPDGKWLAYESNQSGKNEVYITPFPADGAQYQVSTDGGERPVWRRDGKEIFYREYLTLKAVEVKTKADTIELGPPKALFEVAVHNLSGRWYDVAPDGRFLMNASRSGTQTQNFELVINWPELNK
jgi:Tol biopolymer transport system component